MSDSIALALLIDRLMRRIHAELQPRSESFDTEGVGPLGGMLLLTLGENDAADMRSVVQQLGRDKAQITRLVQRLETQGLIRKTVSVTDRRASVLHLTDKGRRQLERIEGVLGEVVAMIAEPLTSREVNQLTRLLERLLEGKS